MITGLDTARAAEHVESVVRELVGKDAAELRALPYTTLAAAWTALHEAETPLYWSDDPAERRLWRQWSNWKHTLTDAIRDQWAAEHHLRPSHGRTCIGRLLGHPCPISHTWERQRDLGFEEYGCLPPFADHCSLWIEDGKPAVFVSQPYGWSTERRDETFDYCERLGLLYAAADEPSCHYPGHVKFVTYWRAG